LFVDVSTPSIYQQADAPASYRCAIGAADDDGFSATRRGLSRGTAFNKAARTLIGPRLDIARLANLRRNN
jgi:hypothetical protein